MANLKVNEKSENEREERRIPCTTRYGVMKFDNDESEAFNAPLENDQDIPLNY